MIKLIREHLSTKIFIITVCLLITVGSAIYGMVALGMSRSYFLELDRSLSNQTEKMVLQLSNTSVQEIDGILKMFALEHGISIVLKDSDEKVLGIYGDMEYSLAPGTDVEDILLGSGITESYSCKLTNGKTYWIQVFGNKEKVNIGLESLKRILPMLGAITFLAALAIAALYTKYITPYGLVRSPRAPAVGVACLAPVKRGNNLSPPSAALPTPLYPLHLPVTRKTHPAFVHLQRLFLQPSILR